MSAPESVAEYARRKAIAKLHVAKARLALTDDSYRAILRRVAGIDSAAQANDAQLAALLAEMRRLGFADRRLSDDAQVRKEGVFLKDHTDAAFLRRNRLRGRGDQPAR